MEDFLLGNPQMARMTVSEAMRRLPVSALSRDVRLQATPVRGRFTAHMVSAVTDVKGAYLPPPRLVRGFLI